MLAGVYNLTIEQGSTFARLIAIQQPDLEADPTGSTFENYDINGYTARMHIRRTIDSATPMIVLTTENGRIDVNPEFETTPTKNNEISLLLSATDTSSLSTSGVYDLEIVSPGSLVLKVIRGDVTLIPEVTR